MSPKPARMFVIRRCLVVIIKVKDVIKRITKPSFSNVFYNLTVRKWTKYVIY